MRGGLGFRVGGAERWTQMQVAIDAQNTGRSQLQINTDASRRREFLYANRPPLQRCGRPYRRVLSALAFISRLWQILVGARAFRRSGRLSHDDPKPIRRARAGRSRRIISGRRAVVLETVGGDGAACW